MKKSVESRKIKSRNRKSRISRKRYSKYGKGLTFSKIAGETDEQPEFKIRQKPQSQSKNVRNKILSRMSSEILSPKSPKIVMDDTSDDTLDDTFSSGSEISSEEKETINPIYGYNKGGGKKYKRTKTRKGKK